MCKSNVIDRKVKDKITKKEMSLSCPTRGQSVKHETLNILFISSRPTLGVTCRIIC